MTASFVQLIAVMIRQETVIMRIATVMTMILVHVIVAVIVNESVCMKRFLIVESVIETVTVRKAVLLPQKVSVQEALFQEVRVQEVRVQEARVQEAQDQTQHLQLETQKHIHHSIVVKKTGLVRAKMKNIVKMRNMENGNTHETGEVIAMVKQHQLLPQVQAIHQQIPV